MRKLRSRSLPAGMRHTRVTVERLKHSAVQNAGGHITEANDTNWETATDIGTNGKIWASVQPRGSREFFRADQVAADITHRVEVTFDGAWKTTTKMRLKFADKQGVHVLNIADPPRNVDQRNHSLVFACIEAVEGQGAAT